MSDSNDKKPASSSPGWPSASDPARQGTAAGHSIDDPLAELDRIVNQNYGSGGQQHGVVSDEDLRFLEQELIRELRGKQGVDQQSAPAARPDPVASQPASPARPQTSAQDSDQLSRPHPLSPSASAAQSPAAPRQPAAEPRNGPTINAPDYPAARPEQPSQPGSRYAPEPVGHRPEERLATQPQTPQPSQPRAAMPSSDHAAKSSFAAPSLDDWSNLFTDDTPDTSYDDPATASERGGATSGVSAPSVDAGGAVSGSYGQLKRSSTRDQQTDDRLGAYRPDRSTAPSYDHREASPAVPPVSSTWDEEVATPSPSYPDPARDYRPQATSARDTAPVDNRHYSSYTDPGHVDHGQQPGYVPAYDPAPAQYVPEVAAPVASDLASDPYAAFNQHGAQPEQGYDPALGYGAAPSVDVTGQGGDYAAQDPRYYDQQNYDPQIYTDPHSPQAHDPNYAAYDPAYQSDYAHGTYADPAVAQAAMEGSPYVHDDEYSAADVEAAAAASAAAAQRREKSRKKLVPIVAAVAVVLLGGVAAWSFFGGDNGSTETPVITADTDPVKEAPEDPGGKVVPHQNKTVYNRIDGTETDEAPSSMMPATETPMAIDNNGQSPRVIDMSSGKSNNPADPGSIAPKEVRTVIVRPDGTIVPQSNQSGTAQTNPLLQATPSESALQQTLNSDVNGANNQPDLTTAPATAPLPRSKPAELVALQEAAQSTQQAVQNTVAPQTNQNAQTNSGPLVLSPGNTPTLQAPTPQVPINNVANGQYTVQVTSQRSRDQARASYASIQAQLPSVLSGYQPDIKEADLGERGTYYRVRVGSFADRASATSFCSSIKAAGGDCLVARK
ncbi:SPOR domain-containing protein [Cohaesibacter sp. ES.047]|uniref:SPOR domain-containing protein n=1 Tax=Cohaesibacter sp. ES.047 TaxID=1798205 RepID=UPI0012FD5BA1|nr:SPOR domain-containing protein [Cohaesibacter sp. ES.047]